MLFTTWTKEVKRYIWIGNTLIPTVHHSKILAIVFDNFFIISKSVKGVTARPKGRVKVLKIITASTWARIRRGSLITTKPAAVPLATTPQWASSFSYTNW